VEPDILRFNRRITRAHPDILRPTRRHPGVEPDILRLSRRITRVHPDTPRPTRRPLAVEADILRFNRRITRAHPDILRPTRRPLAVEPDILRFSRRITRAHPDILRQLVALINHLFPPCREPALLYESVDLGDDGPKRDGDIRAGLCGAFKVLHSLVMGVLLRLCRLYFPVRATALPMRTAITPSLNPEGQRSSDSKLV
jgi:hypothetical protein